MLCTRAVSCEASREFVEVRSALHVAGQVPTPTRQALVHTKVNRSSTLSFLDPIARIVSRSESSLGAAVHGGSVSGIKGDETGKWKRNIPLSKSVPVHGSSKRNEFGRKNFSTRWGGSSSRGGSGDGGACPLPSVPLPLNSAAFHLFFDVCLVELDAAFAEFPNCIESAQLLFSALSNYAGAPVALAFVDGHSHEVPGFVFGQRFHCRLARSMERLPFPMRDCGFLALRLRAGLSVL